MFEIWLLNFVSALIDSLLLVSLLSLDCIQNGVLAYAFGLIRVSVNE